MTEIRSADQLSPYSGSLAQTSKRSEHKSISLAAYLGQQVNQIAVLAVVIGIITLFFPFMSVFPTRVMPIGEHVSLWDLSAGISMGAWVLIAWLSVLAAALLPKGQLKTILLIVTVTTVSLLIIGISSFATEALVQSELSRISLSTGAWLSGLAVYIALFSVYQQSPRFLFFPILCIAVFVYFAPFEHWGIYKEFSAAPDAFKNELFQHILLVLSALPLIIVFGVILGFIATRKSWLEEVILSVNGFVQTIPSIALYGLLLPLLSVFGKNFTVDKSLIFLAGLWGVAFILFYLVGRNKLAQQFKALAWILVFFSVLFLLPILTNIFFQVFSNGIVWVSKFSLTATWESLGIRGLGTTPALIALVVYGVFPLIVNVHSSIQSIPAELTDAAKGIGLSSWQVFWKVQFPLTLPFLIDGIRLSCLMLISLTTVAVIVNAGGLGVFLMRGTEQSVSDLILLGCIPAVVMALIVDALLRVIQEIITPEGLKK